ncbi:kinase-like domain-containing protein [Massariosphaeria phaeospora]|uniref:Kinase-like domain-containing protein n=1 Tax=Massariosphaeria phaeospora TaxID=100035 RepID=A0A7C8IKW7_9PLEO|nr:kinase-like domain-containing protein [Massariosphaeria phaeospora]
MEVPKPSLQGDLPSSTPPSGPQPAARSDESSSPPHAEATATTTSQNSAPANATASLLNAQLPSSVAHSASGSLPIYPPRPHIRTPSAAGLQLQTDLPLFTTTVGPLPSNHPAIVEDTAGDPPRHSATAPIGIQGGYLRSNLSAGSMTGSLSPGSALSSPALNAIGDMTPLPSPLIMGESPGPWARAGMSMRPRGASNSSRDDSFVTLGRATLSPSPSLKKKGYHGLKTAAVEAAAASMHTHHKNEESRERNRSISEFTPDSLHNIRARHVTISNVAPSQMDAAGSPEALLHREQYLAGRRGLVSITSNAGLPTPPASNASNASNRSVTESEEEEVAEDPNIQYLMVRQGPRQTKKLWRPVRTLGQGTFSKVYLATSERVAAQDPLDETTLDPRKLVAIKVVEHGPAGGADEHRVELSLKREVEILRSVSHPALVHLRAFDHTDAQALIVLTYCPGGDLFDVASTHREVLGVDLVQRIFAEMVSAVRYLHTELIVHRDIKLENVLLNIPIATVPLLKNPQSHPYPIATLTDLGLSRRIPPLPESPLLTTRCGSEDYAAPEILLGQPYDGRLTDAWALGVLLYALMEGRLPFDPPPGKAGSRSRAVHRIARCDWMWTEFGDDDGDWDVEKGKEWGGARECVEGLLKKVSRGRKLLEDVEKMDWVQQGIQVDDGLRKRIEDEDAELAAGDSTAR